MEDPTAQEKLDAGLDLLQLQKEEEMAKKARGGENAGRKGQNRERFSPYIPHVREQPKNVKKSFKEIVRAVHYSKDYAVTWCNNFYQPMVANGISSETASKITREIMQNLFNITVNFTEKSKKVVYNISKQEVVKDAE
jgi:hypothetical protein